MKTRKMEEIVNAFKSKKAKTIIKALKSSKLNNDQSTLKTINSMSGKVNLSLGRFNRIRKDIVSPADKKLLLHFKDSTGAVVKTYHLQDRLININNLFIDQENKYSSGADVELNVLPSTSITNLKPFKSIRQLKEDYNDITFDPESDPDDMGYNYPCFLFALHKAGVDPKVVKRISQTMFNSGATVDFIRKTATAFNLCISVKQFRIDKTSGRAKNDITIYGEKSSSIFKLGSVGEHLFAIAPTSITKGALDNPELVAEHRRSDFRIKGSRVVFNDKKIKLLDSYEVISYLYHRRETHLTPITQQIMPYLLNNKFQEVRSLDEEDFHENNFKEMGRIPGKEMKLGQAVFRAFNSKTHEYYDVRKYNVIYFDFETLVINGIHVPYCVSYSISEFNENSPSSQTFSETRNIYGFGCEKQFLESLPSNSKNLLWAYNAGFDARFLLKHMSYSSKDTNMIDCGSKIKQAHGFYKGREIIIKDSMSFLAGGLARLPKMFKDASSSLSLEKECFPHALIKIFFYYSNFHLKNKKYKTLI
ncbi:unnamed protein product [Phytophthora fragariaefolia]|uniref:Unnamed protein product n=1 Tax=Phytophthora fragariaefolia TaxID=1490495 RepID=A0A9W7DBF0_9STRA|nr:unnamed protein product [Phytophthora fragariaefolia]